jgi:hypothetical protein
MLRLALGGCNLPTWTFPYDPACSIIISCQQ